MIKEFCAWLSATALSQGIQATPWAVPLIQTIHIIGIGVTLTSMAMLGLRLLGLAGRRQTMQQVATRLLPWMWRAVIVMLATGLLLIVAEPGRSLPNWVFQIKMVLLVCVLTLSHAIQRARVAVPNDGAAIPPGGDIPHAKIFGLLTLVAWTSIVVAGRWIAYV